MHQLTPDGVHYLRMMQGQRAPMPFAMRTLVPTLASVMGGRQAFVWMSRLALVLAVAVFGLTLRTLGTPPERLALAAAIFAMTPWLGRWLWACPILTDHVMHLAVSLGVYACVTGDPHLCMAALVLATFTREYGALLILSVIPGFLGWGWTALGAGMAASLYLAMRLQIDADPPRPIPGWEAFWGPPHRVAMHCLRFHGWKLLNPLRGWGLVGVLAVLGAMNAPDEILRLAPVLVVAWLQAFMGTDLERFYSHAWPFVIACAVCL